MKLNIRLSRSTKPSPQSEESYVSSLKDGPEELRPQLFQSLGGDVYTFRILSVVKDRTHPYIGNERYEWAAHDASPSQKLPSQCFLYHYPAPSRDRDKLPGTWILPTISYFSAEKKYYLSNWWAHSMLRDTLRKPLVKWSFTRKKKIQMHDLRSLPWSGTERLIQSIS